MFGSVSEHFVDLRHVIRSKNCVLSLNTPFRGTKLTKMVSQRNHPFNSIRPKMMFRSVSEHFADLRHVKRSKTCVSGLHALFRGTEHAKMVSQRNHPFNSIRPKIMFRRVSQHFTDLRHIIRSKTCVSGLNALFQYIELAKMVSQWNHLFYSIRPEMMFGSVWEHLKNLQHVKRSKPCVSSLNVLFWGPNLWKWFRYQNIHSTPFDAKQCLGVFQSISLTFGTSYEAKIVFRAWIHHFGVPNLRKWFHNEIIHSTPLDPRRCFDLFLSISQTFDT